MSVLEPSGNWKASLTFKIEGVEKREAAAHLGCRSAIGVNHPHYKFRKCLVGVSPDIHLMENETLNHVLLFVQLLYRVEYGK